MDNFNRLEQDLADLNGVFRFVVVSMTDPAWCEIDQDDQVIRDHRSITIRLSHVGASADDHYHVFDDTTLESAVHQMWERYMP